MFERLLVRLAKSEYKDKFVLKGSILVAAIVGLDNRATMDLDTTLKNLPLAPEKIKTAFSLREGGEKTYIKFSKDGKEYGYFRNAFARPEHRLLRIECHWRYHGI